MEIRAVVLGGGGPIGIAWETGVLAGLLQEGVDLREADAVFGTSAGAFVGAWLAGGYDPDRLYAAQQLPKKRGNTSPPDPSVAAQWAAALREGGTDEEKIGRLIGKIARTTPPRVSPEERRAVVRSRMEAREWPPKLRVTAVEVDTGKLRVLDVNTGISLEDGLNASGAYPGVWPIVSFLGKDWMDGGIISSTNACLAKDYGTIVILAPAPGGTGAAFGAYAEAAKLQQNASVALLTPDGKSLSAMGGTWFDAGNAPKAAEAGFRQGRSAAPVVKELWESNGQ